MTFQDSIGDRLQQFALAQFDLATTCLTETRRKPETAIHETRRCLKRIRALLRMVRTQLAPSIYDRENLYLRNIGQRLAALRDAAIMQETLKSLKKQTTDPLARSTWRELQKELATARTPLVQRQKKRMATTAAKLRTARTRAEKWELEFSDITVVQKGVQKVYRQGRRAMKRVLKEPTAENFHEWRKQVNHLRHQLQIVQTLKLGKVRASLEASKTLANLLGRKNDIAVLSRHLCRRKSTISKSTKQAIRKIASAHDQPLDTAVRELGQQFYARTGKAFIKHLWATEV